ncbi:MAG: alpha-amylase family protein [Candidatus Aminicenantales bacterium]
MRPRSRFRSIFVILAAAALPALFAEAGRQAPAGNAAKKPFFRRDAFFGLHFDLHPSDADTALGADVTDGMVGGLLDRIKPDYVQYDCKGHVGWAGYPTKVGWAAPGIKNDSLAVWRKATRTRGVGLFIHYSGVWDALAIVHHPEWARLDAQGRIDAQATSVFGGYKDGLLVPQLKEAVTAYDLDGLWVDGECWGARLDYSPAAMAAWTRETGRAETPEGRGDPNWLEWKMFNRRGFEKYLSSWVDALHAFKPGLQITSNWMYSSFAPKPIEAKLDYLSGDYSPSLSVDRARVEARYLASTGMPWDLMAWGFDKNRDLGWSIKPAVQLMQEAAVVLMQGGGFQVYHTPTRSGFISPAIVDQLEKVAGFCRARQAASFKSKSIPQVALLLSSESHWDVSDNVFSPSGGEFDELEGALHALLELGYSVDILAEHQLQPRLAEFPLVVVPDSPKLAPAFRDALLRSVEAGGSLLLLGEKCARLFAPALGATLEGRPRSITAELASPSGPVNVDGRWQDIVPATARTFGFRHPTRDTRKDGSPAATASAYGKGRIAAVYGPLADIYFRSHHPAIRQFLGGFVRDLFPAPAVRVDGPPVLDVSLRTTAQGKLSVHLLNRSNLPLSDRFNFADYITPVGPITVHIKTAKKPSRVMLAPANTPLKWEWKDGVLRVAVPRVEIHEIVVVD